MKEPKISIIVPVYNVEKYISKCMESLINQTFSDIEIIAVNDESPDGSLEVLEKYQKVDSRIKIINQENKGVSGARNTGINQANAPYIMFVDGDDWIDKNTCEEAYKALKDNAADIIMWDYCREYINKSLVKGIFNSDKVFDEQEAKNLHRRFMGITEKELINPENSDSLATVWGKLYRKDIILANNLKFIDLKIIGTYEDGLFNLYYFKYVKKALYITKAFSHYLKINDNAFTKGYKEDLFNKYQNLFEVMNDYIEKNNLDETYKTALDNRRCMSLIGIGLTECIKSNPKNHIQRIKYIKKIINNKEYKSAYSKLEIEYMPLKWKVFFGFAKYNFATGVYVLLMIITKIISR